MSNERRPLAGITVLDFTRALSGPHATFILAGLGADVIKIEDPAGGDHARLNPPFYGDDGPAMVKTRDDQISMAILNRARGKRSMTLNLKAPGALEVYRDLLERADVVIENFSAGVADRLGIGYRASKAIKPDIVYCALSGFGADQNTTAKAMDTVIQGLSGSALTGGHPDEPPMPVGYPLADVTTPLFCVIGILAALQRRDRTGAGDFVDVSMLGSLTSLVATEDWEVWRRLGVPTRNGRRLPRLAPFGLFACKDGYFSLTASRDHFAHRVFELIGRPELIDDPEYRTTGARVAKDGEIAGMIEDWAAQYTVDEVTRILNDADVPAAAVREPLDAVNATSVAERGETIPVVHPRLGELEGMRTAGIPIVFDDAVIDYGRPAPGLGEHNDELYGDFLGYRTDRIAELRDRGVL